MDSLRSLSSPTARVVRDVDVVTIPSGDDIPRDLVEVKVGDTIPLHNVKFICAGPLK